MTQNTFDTLIAQAKATRPALHSRIDKAAEIIRQHFEDVRADVIYVTVKGGDWCFKVRSSRGEKHYSVVVAPSGVMSCDCEDARRGHTCKHELAARILRRILGGHTACPDNAGHSLKLAA